MKIEVILSEKERRFYCNICGSSNFVIDDFKDDHMNCIECNESIKITDDMDLLPME